MKAPDEDQLRHFAHLGTNGPGVVEYIEQWFKFELHRLPSVSNNVAVAQGRCQVLGELVRLISEAPTLVAQRRPPQPRSTHTDRSV